jgi:hypothetical protein
MLEAIVQSRGEDSGEEEEGHKKVESTKDVQVPSILSSSPESPTKQSNGPLQTNIDSHHNSKERIQVIVDGQPAWYTGPLKGDDKVPHGTGTIKFGNGDTYFGHVTNGEMHGFGTMFCDDTMEMKRGQFEHDAYVED